MDRENKRCGEFFFSKFWYLTPVQGLFMFQLFFNGAKQLILAVWTYSPNYASNNIFDFFNAFVDHRNIGKELKFMVLSCTVQKLWVRIICHFVPLSVFLDVFHVPITFEPDMIEPWILVLYLCFPGLRTHWKNRKCYWMHSLGCRAKWPKWAVLPHWKITET